MRHRKSHRQSSQAASERLEARVGSEQKMFFQRAAALRGVTLKEFMVASMHEAAVRTVEEHELLTLSAEEQKVFVEALLNPPLPNRTLREATKRYRRMVSE